MTAKILPGDASLRRGFADVHTPPAFASELCMSAATELELIATQCKALAAISTSEKSTKQEKYVAHARIQSLAKRKEKVLRHVRTSINREALLIKRMRPLLTHEQFARCCAAAELDYQYVLANTTAWSDEDESATATR